MIYRPTEKQSESLDAIMQAVKTGGGRSFMIKAVPGAGKTSTAEYLFSLLPNGLRLIATTFTKSARDASHTKFGNSGKPAKLPETNKAFNKMYSLAIRNNNGALAFFPNVNQLGYSILRNAHPNVRWTIPQHTNKWYKPINEKLKQHDVTDWQVVAEYRQLLMNAISTIRADYLSLDNRTETAENLVQQGVTKDMDIAYWAIDIVIANLCDIREKVKTMVGKEAVPWKSQPEIWIDFEDQIYLPLMLKANDIDEPFLVDMLIADEVQNSNRARILLMRYVLAPNGIFVGLGDPNQAIMGFAGSTFDIWNIARAVFDADEYTFPDSFRFGQVIADELKFLVDVNGRGHHSKLSMRLALPSKYNVGDGIIVRTNAQLIEIALMLKKKDIPFKFENDNLSLSTQRFMETVHSEYREKNAVYSPTGFASFIETRASRKKAFMNTFAPKSMIDNMLQEHAVASLLVREIPHQAYDGLKQHVKEIFDVQAGVIITTAHTSQSKEYGTVYIIPQYFYKSFFDMFERKAHPQDLYSEVMVYYVALSRAMHEICYTFAPAGRDSSEAMDYPHQTWGKDITEGLEELVHHALQIYRSGQYSIPHSMRKPSADMEEFMRDAENHVYELEDAREPHYPHNMTSLDIHMHELHGDLIDEEITIIEEGWGEGMSEGALAVELYKYEKDDELIRGIHPVTNPSPLIRYTSPALNELNQMSLFGDEE